MSGGGAPERALLERPPLEGWSDPPLPCLEEALAGVRLYHAIVAGLEIGLFDRLADPMGPGPLAEALGTREDLTTLLCDALVSRGVLVREGDCYKNSPKAQVFLAKESTYSIRGMIAFYRQHVERWQDLSRILREGPVTLQREEFFCRTVIPSMAEHARCGLLQRVTSLVATLPGFSEARTLLDLAGGHGLYAIAFTALNPRLSATVFDLPAVTAATRDFIARYGADRVSVVAGDFNTDPLPGPVDILYSSSHPGGKDPRLIPKIAAALGPGGLFINKQGRDGTASDPFEDLEWNLWTFEGVQKHRSRYTFTHSVPLAEYHRALEEHGLTVLGVIPVDETSEMTVARKDG
ncbi:MAG TPA: methyltransferase [Methanoregulaceae archaeon]|nr:methyltransferase [Methanoregulaceae archaeon]